MKKDNTQFIELIKNQKSNFPLDQLFYTDANIYRNDLDTFAYNLIAKDFDYKNDLNIIPIKFNDIRESIGSA